MKNRLESIDALRGFDMLFISGLAALITALCALFPGSFGDTLALQMTHAQWDGLRHHDTIFPLFLFIAGMTFPFSAERHPQHLLRKVIFRGCALVFLGMVYNGLFDLDFGHLRCASVLGRIGLAWMIAALLFMYFKTGTRAVIAVVILAGYWAVSSFVTAPDAPAGADAFSKEGCIAGYIDRLFLPGRLYGKIYDPEGLLSTVPAVVTAMLGMFTGELLKCGSLSGKRKCLIMAVAGAVLFAAGLLWDTVYPINKALWSGSFVLAVGGYSLLMTALFHYIIEVKGWRKWAFFLRVVGMNSITVYMAMAIIDFGAIAAFFFGGTAGLFSQEAGAVISEAGTLAVIWLFLYFLYRKKVFLKI